MARRNGWVAWPLCNHHWELDLRFSLSYLSFQAEVDGLIIERNRSAALCFFLVFFLFKKKKNRRMLAEFG